jgi:precorrin-2 dehydrogenase/sirohydrochlorin ferrochelatase
VSLNIENKLCLVVGGGKVAERKALTLLEYGAQVRLVAPAVTEKLAHLGRSGRITLVRDAYGAGYLEGVFLVIGATDDDAVNASVSSDCMSRGILVNVVDDPPRGNFYVPAVVRRGSLQIAVSTDGKSPLLARKIKERLEEDFPEGYADLVDLIGSLREKIISAAEDAGQKEKRLSRLLEEDIMELLKQGKFDLAKERILNADTGGGGKSQDRPR